jgi:hypothetical protein
MAKQNGQKLTDAERHKRFVDMARKVEASDDPNDFEKAFKKVVPPPKPNRPRLMLAVLTCCTMIETPNNEINLAR